MKKLANIVAKLQGQTSDEMDWPIFSFLVLNLVLSLLLTGVYLIFAQFNWEIWGLFFVLAFLTNLSITAGYHRLYAHRSYEAKKWVQFFYLLFATAAWQGSALQWSTGHRVHHKEVDTDEDPYSITKGFWFAHMKWMFLKAKAHSIKAPDLEKNSWIVFQHRYYVWLAIFVGYLVPAFVGWLVGDFWGGLIVLGGLRIALTQQSTYLVNSLAHTLGRQTYSDEVSARDNFFVALLTHGEGYHNFHHNFQIDFRNGVRWYQWDPTKWLILGLRGIGGVSHLRRVPNEEILKARLQMESRQLEKTGFALSDFEALRIKILNAQAQIRKLRQEAAHLHELRKQKFQELKSAWEAHSQQARIQEYKMRWHAQKMEVQKMFEQRRLELRLNLQIQQIEFEKSLRQWRICLRAATQ